MGTSSFDELALAIGVAAATAVLTAEIEVTPASARNAANTIVRAQLVRWLDRVVDA
ncbi:MAG TPA: hypothetical protein VIU61_27325 [Kofleriaceae bacterium]